MTDHDLLKAITEGPLENRRLAIKILASHQLYDVAYSSLGACYSYSVSSGERPNRVQASTMQSAYQILGLVLEEVLCTSSQLYAVKSLDLMDRISNHRLEYMSHTSMRKYIKASLRLLTIFGVLKESAPIYKKRYHLPYEIGNPKKIINIYHISVNRPSKHLVVKDFKEVSQDEIEMILATIPPPLYKVITGETLAPPKPAPLLVEEQASDDQGPTEVEGLSGDLKQAILHVYTEHNKLARSLKHQRVFYTDKQNYIIKRLEEVSDVKNQLLKLNQQFEALCAALQWKPPA